MRRRDLPDATELLRQMREGERSSAEIVREHLDRLDAEQPRLNAATEILRDEALAEAENPKPGPLSGLPITLKETYGLAGHAITGGSARMPPIPVSEDAPVVKKLRDAGAIVIARSNVPEFVMTAETRNLRYGKTSNPLDPKRVAGGSTGGEGALVGSGASPMGFGTDILGSIRIPSCFCGIAGLRPHSGAVDKTGVWPESGPFFETWNGIGPMARSVRDLRLAYDVMAKQPAAAPSSVDGLRLLVPKNFPFKAREACIDEAWQSAVQDLEAAGMALQQDDDFSDVGDLYIDALRVVTGEMTDVWKDWLSRGGQRFSVAKEALAQLLRRPTVDPAFFLWLLLAAPLYKPKSDAALAEVIGHIEEAREKYYALLGGDGILCLPTLGMLAPKHGAMNRITLLSPGVNKLMTADTFVNYINLSALSVPAWRFQDAQTGLVPGIMLACAPGAEGALLDTAAALENGLSTGI